MLNPFNITISESLEITSQCFTWCKEQIEIYQNNQTIDNLFVITTAMMMLLLHNLLETYGEWLVKNTEITENQVRIIYSASGYFAFILLAIFIFYYTVLQ